MLEDICPDFSEWPNRWMGVAADMPYGQGLLDAMRPFVVHLVESGLALKTIRRHIDNLWLLGGEVVREVGMSDEYDTPPAEKLRDSIDREGGLSCRHLDSESEQRSFDATCRKLHKFLEAND